MSFSNKISNPDSLLIRHASGNYRFYPGITEDDIIYHLMVTGKRKFDSESLVKAFDNNVFGVTSAIDKLLELGVIVMVDDTNYQLDTAKILKKDEDKLKFVYPSKIK